MSPLLFLPFDFLVAHFVLTKRGQSNLVNLMNDKSGTEMCRSCFLPFDAVGAHLFGGPQWCNGSMHVSSFVRCRFNLGLGLR